MSHDFGRVTLHDDGTFTVELGGGDPVAWTTIAENVASVQIAGVSIKPTHFTDAETIGLEGPGLEVHQQSDTYVNLMKKL